MNKIYKALCLLLVSVFFFQCQKDVSFIGGPDTGVPVVITPDPIKAGLQGNVVDENNQPAAGVTITVGSTTTVTNATGFFRINDAALDKNATLVTAQKPGYFKGYRVFPATSGANQVVIKLIKRNLAGTITASSGGSATLSNSAKITLPANGVVVASSGADYAGDVKVYASYIDPSAGDIGETVPGSFAGYDKNGKKVALSSFGMLAVELESAAGEKLQIKSGAVASLTTPIPSAYLSSAPATIALWYVDEQTGLWREEGTATKQGNNYVGDVKHFSYWNCDFRYDAVYLSFTLHNSNGLPLVNVPVRVRVVDSGGLAHGYTDSLGQVKGLVAANKNLLLEVSDPCGNIVYSQNLSPISQNTDLGIITVASGNSSFITLKGTLLDCSGLPVKNGYAIVDFQHFIRYVATDALGNFTTTFITCIGTPVTTSVIGVDQTLQQQSASTTVAVVAPVTDAGNITACGTSSTQYVNYTLDGIIYSLTSAVNDSILVYTISQGTTATTTIFGMKKYPGTDNLSIIVKNVSATGTFPVQSLSSQNYTHIILTQPFNVTFTSYANTAGQFYEGTFSGKFTADSLPLIHNISSTFRVRRN